MHKTVTGNRRDYFVALCMQYARACFDVSADIGRHVTLCDRPGNDINHCKGI